MLAIPITREQFQAAKALLLTHQGITITGDRGTVSHQGVTAEYAYLEVTEMLNVHVTNRPFLISQAAVEDRIRSWFQEFTQ